MKTTLNKLGLNTFERLAKQIGAKVVDQSATLRDQLQARVAFEKECEEGDDVYLWDWLYAIVRIANPQTNLGYAILSAVTDEPSEYRTETPRFSHFAVHNKKTNNLYVCRSCVEDVRDWKHEFEFDENDIDIYVRNM